VFYIKIACRSALAPILYINDVKYLGSIMFFVIYLEVHFLKCRVHTHTHTHIYIYIYIFIYLFIFMNAAHCSLHFRKHTSIYIIKNHIFHIVNIHIHSKNLYINIASCRKKIHLCCSYSRYLQDSPYCTTQYVK